MENHSVVSFLTQIEGIASTYVTDTIFILGKGASADLVRPEVYVGALVIAVNDAERIRPADITLFHAPWVEHALATSGFRSRLYIAPYPFDAGGRPVAVRPFIPLTQESSDLMMQRFLSDSFVIEEVLFISALHLAGTIARLRGRPQTVYMVGFDFDAGGGYSRVFGSDLTPAVEQARHRFDLHAVHPRL